VLYFNGGLMPDFDNTLRLNPVSKFVLNNIPSLYNPTPEIFVERVSNREGGFWDTTIYKNNGKCQKAYVLISNTQKAVNECGEIPERYKARLNNEFLQKANYPRKLYTTEATFFPADESCSEGYVKDRNHPFVCLRTVDEFMKYTGMSDLGRIEKDDNNIGVWRMKWGNPVNITLPSGYIVNHYSFDGIYVDFQ
jgi:hypothetical protein